MKDDLERIFDNFQIKGDSIKETPTSMNRCKNINLNKKNITKLKEFDIVKKKYIDFFLNVKSL